MRASPRDKLPIRVWPAYVQGFYASASESSLRGVTKAAVDVIGDAQPYEARNESIANAHYLAVLKSLADTDKHKALFVVATVPADPSQIAQAFRFPGVEHVDMQLRLTPGQRLEPGTEIARFHLGTPMPNKNAYIDGPITSAVRFHDAEGEDARGDLRWVSGKISGLIDLLEPFVLYPP